MLARRLLILAALTLAFVACDERDNDKPQVRTDTNTIGNDTNTTGQDTTGQDTNTTGNDTTGGGTENTNATCSDGIDNDGDTNLDCNDFDCSRNPAVTVCPAENSNTACSDGIDNDRDEFIDCEDRDCEDRAVCGESTNEACSDGVDNDDDSETDCDDPGCQEEGIVVCETTDGTTFTAVSPLPDPADYTDLADAACTDENDNDMNNFQDCRDFGCSLNPDVTACRDLPNERSNNTLCSDGIDNDKDGAIDCEDTGCSGEGIVVCDENGDPVTLTDEEITAAANALCDNGINEDGNTKSNGDDITDCEDFSCSQDPLITVCASDEGDDVTCSDGIDNDGNGFIDCGTDTANGDFSCTQNPNVTVCETSDEKCGDGLDNDNNGFKDCDDFSCEDSVECE